MISWILFDLTGVISSFAFRTRKSFRVGNTVFSSEKLESIYGSELYNDYMVGRIGQKEYVRKFYKSTGLEISLYEFIDIYRSSIEPIPGMEELIKQLSRSYSLAILTNEGVEWARYKLEGSGMEKYFDEVVISAEIGVAKPEKEYFDEALEIIGAKPEKAVFVDDSEENVIAAEKLGIRSILFESTKQLKARLAKLGINFNVGSS